MFIWAADSSNLNSDRIWLHLANYSLELDGEKNRMIDDDCERMNAHWSAERIPTSKMIECRNSVGLARSLARRECGREDLQFP